MGYCGGAAAGKEESGGGRVSIPGEVGEYEEVMMG